MQFLLEIKMYKGLKLGKKRKNFFVFPMCTHEQEIVSNCMKNAFFRYKCYRDRR